MRVSGRRWLAALAIAGMALAGGSARAMTLGDTNLVDLVRNSVSIVKGTVTTVTDGVDGNGLPYTEVSVAIDETLRGDEQGTYTFRQFGLLEPRLSADGTRKLMPAPEGFPRYDEGEEVLLFLAQPAAMTGLRSTYGLATGKFSFGPGRVENELANQGLFRNVSLEPELITDGDRRMLDTEMGAVHAENFLSLVRRAVHDDWVPRGKMWRTDEGRPGGGRKPVRLGRPDRDSIPSASPTTAGGSTTFGAK